MTSNTPNYVQVPPNSSGLKISTSELTDANSNTVERQNIVIASPTAASQLLDVVTKSQTSFDYGIIVKSSDLTEIKELLFEILMELKERP